MNTQVREIQTYTGRDLLLDLDRYGYDFQEELGNFLRACSHVYNDDQQDLRRLAVQQIFETCVGDVVRLLAENEHQALENLKSLPSGQELVGIIMEMNMDRFSDLMLLCQKYMVMYYIQLKREVLTHNSHAYAYIPVYYRPDLVVAREVHQGEAIQVNTRV